MILMLRMFIVLLCLWSVFCCSTLGLKENSTYEEKKTAVCQDAAAGYALSVVCLDKAMSESPAAVYWTTYKMGVESAMVVYCGKSGEGFLSASGEPLK